MHTQQEPRVADRVSLSLLIRSVSLSLGAAIALGLARFSYALLLPPMKADLSWTFAQAGALNTGNAIGYLAGALAYPLLSRHMPANRLFLGACVLTSFFMATAGYTFDYNGLLAQRIVCGFFSSIIFVSGGVLASRLANANPHHSGLVLGLFYGGAGWGIALSALAVPATLGVAGHGWQASWNALALMCAACSAAAWPVAITIPAGPTHVPAAGLIDVKTSRPPMGHAALLILGYGLFGVGYIGYMTFVIALLRGAGMSSTVTTGFYVVLGLATVGSGRLWSRLLNHARGGGAFSFFCLLLSAATVIPALTTSPIAVFASGIVFGATFLAVVASTTAFVRHNFPAARWSAGITVFTVVFALGQIAGPVLMGFISDGSSLSLGFICSSGILLIAAALAVGQKPLRNTVMAAR